MDEHENFDAEAEIKSVAERLEAFKTRLGARYWTDEEVIRAQDQLRRLIGAFGAWSDERPPLHQRARRQAQLESRFAYLLWAGRETDAG